MFKAPVSLIMRGGVLGLIQQGMFKKVVDWLDKPYIGEKG
jgi:hypothetical protein